MVHVHDVNLHLYADDTQLYIGIHLPEADIAMEKLEVCVGEIRKWMAANMLNLNNGKTEYMLIGSNYMIRQIQPCLNSISIGSSIVSKATSVQNIGVIMDQTLSMEQQVNNIIFMSFMLLKHQEHQPNKTIFDRGDN